MWRIEVTGPNVEQSFRDNDELFELWEVKTFDRGRVYLTSTDSIAKAIADISSLGISVLSLEPIKSNDWIEATRKAWTELKVGNLTIVQAVDDSPSDSSSGPDRILIRPGAGFGTGESATTRGALLVMEKLSGTLRAANSILDIGTGSGILAIAAAHMSDATVEGIDISQAALDNARENLRLNNLVDRVALQLGEPSSLTAPYDIILANLEIGIHYSMFSDYLRLINYPGFLIIAGLRDCVSSNHIESMIRLQAQAGGFRIPKIAWIQSERIGEWSSFGARLE